MVLSASVSHADERLLVLVGGLPNKDRRESGVYVEAVQIGYLGNAEPKGSA